DRGDIAGSFHKTVADMILTVSQYIRDSYNVNSVILSGGVFQNRLLLTLAMKILNENGFSVYINSYLPPNDGCISLGQAYFGAESTL
ncbi:carbamoyltransferase HypF, partial [bacterium]